MNTLRSLRKLAIEELLSFALFFCIVPIQMLETPLYTLLQYGILAVAVVYLLLHCRTWLRRDAVLFCALGMCAAIVLSSTINAAEFWQIREAVFYAAIIVVVFAFLRLLSVENKLHLFVTAAITYLTIVVVLNDGLMILLPDQFYNVDGRDIGTLLLGNKFSAAYAHLLLTAFVALNSKRDKTLRVNTLLMTAVTLLVSLYVDCITIALGCLAFGVLLLLPKKLRRVLSNPVVFLLLLLACAAVVFVLPYVVQFKPVAFIIEDVLHRDISLTGRLDIYGELPAIFLKKPFLGFGYMNMPVKQHLLWYANAQNALLDVLLNYGAVTALGLLALCGFAVAGIKKAAVNKEKLWVIGGMLYAFMFIGIVEITYSTIFFLLLALLSAVAGQKQAVMPLPTEAWNTTPVNKMENAAERVKGLVSVIVPVYNVEDYLDRCVESIVGQTYDRLEIFLVDDGTKDNSDKLCDLWAQKDARITVIHKENGGLSSARNVGLAAAQGEYILFVDSDDWIAENLVQKLVAAIEENQADLACCGLTEVKDGVETPAPWFAQPTVLDRNEALRYLVNNDRLTSHIAPKLYRAYMLSVDLFPIGKLFEDIFIVHTLFLRCDKVAVIPDVLYYYFQHTGSINSTVRLRNRFAWLVALKARYMDIGHVDSTYAESILAQIAEQLSLTYVQNTFTDDELLEYREKRRVYDAWLRERQTGSIIYRYISKKNYLFYLLYQVLGENANWPYQLILTAKGVTKRVCRKMQRKTAE